MAVFRVRLSQPGVPHPGSNRGRSRTSTEKIKKTQGGSQSALDEPKRQSPLSFQTIRTTRTRARDEPRRYEITRSDSHRLNHLTQERPAAQQPLLYRQHPVCIYIPVPVRVRACVLSAVEI